MQGGTALHKIAAELTRLAQEAETHSDAIDPFAIKVIARQIAAQAEMAEIEVRP